MIESYKDINQTTKNEFYSKDVFDKFNEATCKWVSESYVYLIDSKIVAFMLMMKEDLRGGFLLHYHISNDQKEYFIKNYPLINKKTHQVLFVYTAVMATQKVRPMSF